MIYYRLKSWKHTGHYFGLYGPSVKPPPLKIHNWKLNAKPIYRINRLGSRIASLQYWAAPRRKIQVRTGGFRKLHQYERTKRPPEKIRKIRRNISLWVIPKVNFEYGRDWKILDTSAIYFNAACEDHFKKYGYYYRTMYS